MIQLDHMAYQSSKSEQIAYSFKSPTLQFFMPNAPKNASYKLKGSKVEILPVQRVIGKTLLLELPKSADLADGVSFSSGFYDLVIDGKVEKTLAINHDNQESLMECYTPKELETLFDNQDNVKVYNGIFDGSFIEAFRQTSLSKPLWKYFIMAALAFLCIEILIARLMKN